MFCCVNGQINDRLKDVAERNGLFLHWFPVAISQIVNCKFSIIEKDRKS